MLRGDKVTTKPGRVRGRLCRGMGLLFDLGKPTLIRYYGNWGNRRRHPVPDLGRSVSDRKKTICKVPR